MILWRTFYADLLPVARIEAFPIGAELALVGGELANGNKKDNEGAKYGEE